METINFQDSDLDDSFSFSCYDFTSSLGDFSDDDDDDHRDDESYIEIALEPTPTHEKLELRISFSSMVPFPESSGQSLTDNLLHSKTLENLGSETEIKTSSSSSAFSSSSTGSSSCSGGDVSGAPKTPGPPEGSDLSSPHKSIKGRSVQFPVINRLLNMLVSNLRVSSEMGEEKGRPDEEQQLAMKTSNWELVRSRKASKVTAAINGGITKFLIKFRSIKMRSMLSFVKPDKVSTSPQAAGNTKHNKRRSEETLQIRQRLQRDEKKSFKNSFGNGEKSRMLEINFDAIKGVIEAMGMGIRRKDKQTKSCPSSTKSSPIHKGVPSESKLYTRDNSVQAAIAHCKRSFGQTP